MAIINQDKVLTNRGSEISPNTKWVLQSMIGAILCMNISQNFFEKNPNMLVLSSLGWMRKLAGYDVYTYIFIYIYIYIHSSFTKPKKEGSCKFSVASSKWGVWFPAEKYGFQLRSTQWLEQHARSDSPDSIPLVGSRLCAARLRN